jgi:uncharacterized membrane protein
MHHDPFWMHALLAVHIACGASAFLLAPVALASAKGGKTHKRWGMVYLWAMGGVAATALPMALYRPVLFLALVAIFSYYLAFSGYRVLRLKDLPRGGQAQIIDWCAAIFTLIASAFMAWCGAFRVPWVQGMGIPSIVFGLIGMRAAGLELYKFVNKPKEKMFWWYTHLGNFIGSYIAAWTAFLVVTVSPHLGANGRILWLLPTAIGVPAIVLTAGYYRRKFTPKVPATA